MIPSPDPEAARHRAELAEAIDAQRRRSRQAPTRTRTPPYLGATWCNSCDSWCSPVGVCRCNDR